MDCATVTSEVLRETRLRVEAEYRHRLDDDSQPFDGGGWYRATEGGWRLRPELREVFDGMPFIPLEDEVAEGDGRTPAAPVCEDELRSCPEVNVKDGD